MTRDRAYDPQPHLVALIWALVLAMALSVPLLGHDSRVPASSLTAAACTGRNPYAVWVVNADAPGSCTTTGGGAYQAHCCCADGAWAQCGAADGTGYDTVWDEGSSLTQRSILAFYGAGVSCTDVPTGSARTSCTISGIANLTEINDDASCTGSQLVRRNAGDTAFECFTSGAGGIVLDLADDGSNESSAIGEIATIRDRHSVATEPSADKLLLDFSRIIDRYVAGPAASPGSCDDEFDDTSISPWTVVEGGSGTVSATQNSNVEIYDLSTHPGVLLVQTGRATTENVQLRQDCTLADGSAYYVKVAQGGQGTSVNNSFQCGMSLNSSDTSYGTGTWIGLHYDQETSGGSRIYANDGAEIGSLTSSNLGYSVFAITRSTLTYYAFASINGGETWYPLGSKTVGSAFDNVWIWCLTSAAQGSTRPVPVAAFEWFREGSSNPYAPGW